MGDLLALSRAAIHRLSMTQGKFVFFYDLGAEDDASRERALRRLEKMLRKGYTCKSNVDRVLAQMLTDGVGEMRTAASEERTMLMAATAVAVEWSATQPPHASPSWRGLSV